MYIAGQVGVAILTIMIGVHVVHMVAVTDWKFLVL
jgi:hypothetical protein